MFKRLAAVAVATILSGCVSVPPNPMNLATRQGAFVKDATVQWSVEDGKRAENANYVDSKGDMMARIETAVEQQFKTSPAGSVPLVFKIDVKNYTRANAAVGALVGLPNAVQADVTVVRESDGVELGTYKGVMGLYAGGGGLLGLAVAAATRPDIPQVMANTFATNLRARFDAKK